MRVVTDSAIPFIKEYLQDKVDLSMHPGRQLTYAEVKDADILLVRSVTPVNSALLKGTRVKYVGSVTTGHDHLDIEWLNREGIKWGTAAGFNAPAVADYLVSVIAALKSHNIIAQTSVKAAVIGVGRVGRLVAQHLKVLGFKVDLCDPLRQRNEKEFISTPLDEISDVDLITLHVPLTQDKDFPTYHMINEQFLKRQKKDCVLVNTSRGAVIDSRALMQSGHHLHWCLDVFEDEPHINQALLKQAFIATPHIAGYSMQSKLRGVAMIYQQLCNLGFVKDPTAISNDFPLQTLQFMQKQMIWPQVILSIFNPLIATKHMKDQLLAAKVQTVGALFDAMRITFYNRYEIAFAQGASGGEVLEADQKILQSLGMRALACILRSAI